VTVRLLEHRAHPARTPPVPLSPLFVSLSTVKTHLTIVRSKLDARNRTEIAVWAWEHGIVR
jgi:hypothetical protein